MTVPNKYTTIKTQQLVGYKDSLIETFTDSFCLINIKLGQSKLVKKHPEPILVGLIGGKRK